MINKPRVIGGIGEKKSNGGTQWYLQDRIYQGDYTIAIATAFNPYYMIGETMEQLRIRKLTPKECWRLMGFDDEDIDKCIAVGISNAQLYKQAGNSIVVPVLVHIYEELLRAFPDEFKNVRLTSFFSGIGAFEKALDKLDDGK